jgi:predicted  nucleic acid-binding Zn-ribbon protein
MDVKTNKEYTAMLHEIEGVEREIRGREDLILAEMEKAETLQADVKREEQEWKAVEQRFAVEARAHDERAAKLKQELAKLQAERDAVAGGISESVLGLYNRVAKLRGVAVAEAKDGSCMVCHVKLRVQMFSELKRNDAIEQCPHCNRILFFDATPVVAVPSQP